MSTHIPKPHKKKRKEKKTVSALSLQTLNHPTHAFFPAELPVGVAAGTPLKSAAATKASHAATVAAGATVDPAVVAEPKNIGSRYAGRMLCASVAFVPTVVPLGRTVPSGLEPRMNSLKNVKDWNQGC
jgi:hypothetical protein